MRKADETHLANLAPAFRAKAEKFLQEANAWVYREGWQYIGNGSVIGITDSKRDIYLQAGLYSQGRTWDKKARKWTEIRGASRVTWTLESRHVKGEAVDVAPFSHKGKPFWPDPNDEVQDTARRASAFWSKLAEIGEACGMQPGARWKKPDYPHFEDK